MSLRLADDVRFRRILDEGVLLRLTSGEILGLNDVGARVIELVSDGRRERAELAEALRREMEAADDVDVRADVDRFVDELVAAGAVLESPPESARESPLESP